MTAFLAGLLAQAPAPPGAERGEEFGKSSPIALVVILLLLVATILLIRSMGKHLRKVPQSFDPPEEPGTPQGPPEDRDTGRPGAERAGPGEAGRHGP